MFSEAWSKPPTPNTIGVNRVYHGWSVKENRLFFANGYQDPWRDATISAETQHFVGTPQEPIKISNGFHCSDLLTSGRIDPTIAAVQDAALASFQTWLSAWPGHKRELNVDAAPQARGH